MIKGIHSCIHSSVYCLKSFIQSGIHLTRIYECPLYVRQALNNSEVSSTDSTFSKKDYIQVEAMKNGQINIIASSETQSDI